MASKKKPTRQTADYLLSVRRLSKYVPSIAKLKNRTRLTENEKRRIRYREKQLNVLGVNLNQLKPVTPRQAKALGRKKLFKPGINAIQLRNVKPGDKIKIKKNGDIVVESGEGKWIYWPLDRDTVRSKAKMKLAGYDAFKKEFPIETVADLTAKAFKEYNVQEVHLWAHAGRVGQGFQKVEQFIMWVQEKWQAGRYMGTVTQAGGDESSDPGAWINGIAILIEKPEYTKRRRAHERAEREAKKTQKN